MKIFTALIYTARVSFIISQYDNYFFSFNIGVRFSYGMTLVAEQLISLTCMEIKSRHKIFHTLLKKKVGSINYEEVRELSLLFTCLRDAQSRLVRHVRVFLLLDISQLVLLILTGILSVFLVCIWCRGRATSRKVQPGAPQTGSLRSTASGGFVSWCAIVVLCKMR